MMGMGCVYVNCPECRGAGKVIKKETEEIKIEKIEINNEHLDTVEKEIKNIFDAEKEKANDEIISEEIKFEEPEIKKSKNKKVGK
ncbi:MAG: hypothetical protein KA318_00215 [Nitrosomonas sp.]|nr:hypothetical protein [Nitrosomonas sp.]